MPLFEYSALEDRHNIRLLRLLPGRPEDTISCECVHFPLCTGSETYPYIAISYTWGNSSRNHLILLNNRRYYTTESAIEVLLHVRSQNEIKTIWIDAICINQSNVPEKNDQVRLMGRIYSSAQQTLVWLGPMSRDSAMAIDFIPRIKQALEEFQGVKEVTDKMLLEKTSTRYDSPEWQAVGNLFTRPWFQRVWVIQEVALSPAVCFMCGDHTLPWQDIGFMTDTLTHWRLGHLLNVTSSPTNHLTSGVSNFWSMQDTRNNVQILGRRESLAMVLFKSMGFLATDPKDQIYGILGLINMGNVELQPQYENTVQSVYMHAVQWSLVQEESFDLLYLSGITHPRNIPRLPSWVPDFSTDIAINPFGMPSPGHSVHYTAGGSLESAIITYIRFHDGCLIARGVIIDTIDIFGHVRVGSHQEKREEIHKTWNEWIRQAISLVAAHQGLYCGVKAARSFWRTLIADSTHTTKEPAPTHYEKYFQSFKEIYIDDTQYHDLDWKQAQALVVNDTRISETRKTEGYQYLFAFLDASIGRRFCITKRGNLGLVPSEVAKGDKICVLLGAKAPFVVRESSKAIGEQRYLLVGDCYIDSIMAGEGLTMSDLKEIIFE